jgi:riboflavin biosynthesis pyrimidine reductase
VNREFETFSAEKTLRANSAHIGRLTTDELTLTARGLESVGNAWTEQHFDGPFWLSPKPLDRPGLSLVFVQSREGNTAAVNPADLGGGDTDLHLIYEGLSRVAADAVLAGAATAAGRVFFSVWHTELVALRRSLGLPRHPAQVVVSRDGRLDFDQTLLFNVPEVPVFIIAGSQCRERCRQHLSSRSWITTIPTEDDDIGSALTRLESHGVRRISAVGGRTVATALLDAGMVQDLYLTTTERSAGQPNTPLYTGTKPIGLELVVRKRTAEGETPAIRFEHLLVSNSG